MPKLLASIVLLLLSLTAAFGQGPRALDDVKPSLGLQMVDTKDALQIWKQNNMPARSAPKKGVMIATVVVGSAAHKAGIKKLDLLDKVNNATVRTVDRVDELLADKQPGDVIDVQIRRMAANGSWKPIKGQVKCGTARTAAYSQMNLSGSSVNQSYRLSHVWFSGRENYVSPVIVCNQSSCSLFVQLSVDNSEGIHPKSLTIRSGDKTASLQFNGLKIDTDIYTGVGEARVHETISTAITPEFEALLRSPKGNLQCRVDGFNKYTEFELTELDQSAIRVALSVYDDIVATQNRDFTLGGRVVMSE